MRIDAFDFELPPERIALRPAAPRESARLLRVDKDLTDHRIAELPMLLRPGDVMVFNDTRVIPAQLSGKRGDVNIELTLHQRAGPGRWQAFARPARRLRGGDRVKIAEDFCALVLTRSGAVVELDFECDDATLRRHLERHGRMPLPPYIRSRRSVDAADLHDYQTIFAEREGAIAAPTAGLHFTAPLLAQLAERGIEQLRATLHVGAGTFLPVTADDTKDHVMLPEYGSLNEECAHRLSRAKAEGRRLIAVGSTGLRLLESATDEGGAIRSFNGETTLFITPGYRFRAVDLLLTNFHLPRSTLFMLVAAFAGLEKMRAAYAHAIETGYRFYSYGDACLLSRPN